MANPSQEQPEERFDPPDTKTLTEELIGPAAVLVGELETIRSVLLEADQDCLGTGNTGYPDNSHWPIRDEVIAGIEKKLANFPEAFVEYQLGIEREHQKLRIKDATDYCLKIDHVKSKNSQLLKSLNDLLHTATDRAEGAYEAARQASAEGEKQDEARAMGRMSVWEEVQKIIRAALEPPKGE